MNEDAGKRGCLRVAVGQLRSTPDITANMATCRELMATAKGYGADMITFPENAPFLGYEQQRLATVEDLDGPIISGFSAMCREFSMSVLVGSFSERSADPGRSYNTSVMLDRSGVVRGVYRKIHLFDVDIEGGPQFVESETIMAGDRQVCVDVEGVRFGMSVCYDLRFPEMYRSLRGSGASALLVPAAFTAQTGRDHWEVLLRARAIENQCYVIAPDQYGHHIKGRESYGHSMIIDPWGAVIARVSDGVGVAVADLDLDRVARIRASMPCWEHAVGMRGG